MATEITTFRLTGNATVQDPATPAAKTLCSYLDSTRNAAGAQQAYYGQLIEKQETVIVFVQWASPEKHEQFIASPEHDSLSQSLQPFFDPMHTIHVPFFPTLDISDGLGSHPDVNVSEVVFFYFPKDLSATARAALTAENIEKMRPVVQRSEAVGVFDGWALENDVALNGMTVEKQKEGVSGLENDSGCQVYVNVVGWADVEAHMRFQASEDFGANVHYIADMKDLRGTELYHVKLSVTT